MTNFTKIRCTQCGARIRPKRGMLSLIGGVGGGIGGGLGGLVGVYAINSGNWMFAGLLFLLLILLLVLVSAYFTLKFTKFIELPENV